MNRRSSRSTGIIGTSTYAYRMRTVTRVLGTTTRSTDNNNTNNKQARTTHYSLNSWPVCSHPPTKPSVALHQSSFTSSGTTAGNRIRLRWSPACESITGCVPNKHQHPNSFSFTRSRSMPDGPRSTRLMLVCL